MAKVEEWWIGMMFKEVCALILQLQQDRRHQAGRGGVMGEWCNFDENGYCYDHADVVIDGQRCESRHALCTHAAAALKRRVREAFRVLARLGLVEHVGTWITREEADRIIKDGP